MATKWVAALLAAGMSATAQAGTTAEVTDQEAACRMMAESIEKKAEQGYYPRTIDAVLREAPGQMTVDENGDCRYTYSVTINTAAMVHAMTRQLVTEGWDRDRAHEAAIRAVADQQTDDAVDPGMRARITRLMFEDHPVVVAFLKELQTHGIYDVDASVQWDGPYAMQAAVSPHFTVLEDGLPAR